MYSKIQSQYTYNKLRLLKNIHNLNPSNNNVLLRFRSMTNQENGTIWFAGT